MPEEKRKKLPVIRVTEVAGAKHYGPRQAWIARTFKIKKPANHFMLRGTAQHGLYEVLNRDMFDLVSEHGDLSAPEIVMVLRDHLLTKGMEEIVPDLIRSGADEFIAKSFIIGLIDEVAYLYVTTYNHQLFHMQFGSVNANEIIVRESRKGCVHRGYWVTGKPDWYQYITEAEGFLVDYKGGMPKVLNDYHKIQASGYSWLKLMKDKVTTYFNIIYYQGYHYFSAYKPSIELWVETLDWYIDMIESSTAPSVSECKKCGSCLYCDKEVKTICTTLQKAEVAT